jgi:hypothetical protein
MPKLPPAGAELSWVRIAPLKRATPDVSGSPYERYQGGMHRTTRVRHATPRTGPPRRATPRRAAQWAAWGSNPEPRD